MSSANAGFQIFFFNLSFPFRIPGLYTGKRPFRCFVRMADVAAIGSRLALVFTFARPDRDSRRDKIESVIARFGPYGVLASLGHMTIDALAARAGRGVVGML